MPTVDNLDIQISASAQSAEKSLESLIKTLSELSTSLGKIDITNLTKMSKAFENIGLQGEQISKTNKNIFKGFNNIFSSATKTTKSVKSLSAVFGSFYANFFWLIRGAKALGNAIEDTADYIEAYNYFNVAMGKIGDNWSHQFEEYGYENAEAYADSFASRLSDRLSNLSGLRVEIDSEGKGILTTTGTKNLGLNIREVTQYASQLGSVTNSIGLVGEVSLAAADAFTKLGADMSSLFNMDYSSVMKNLQSGLIGQSRAMYKYGIDITNATLQTYAYELGLSKAVSEMTQAEKMQLRILAILKQSKVAWGDLAATINSPTNMIRQFTNNISELSSVIGQLFIPVLTKVMPIINGVVIAIKNLMVAIAGLLGVKLNFGEFGDGYNAMEEDIGGVTESIEEMGGAAEKTRKSLGHYDELNVVPSASSAGGGGGFGGGGGIDLTDEILAATAEYQKAWEDAFNAMESKSQEIADKITNAFKLGDYEGIGEYISNGITNALNSIPWESVYSVVSNFGTGLAQFMNGLISPELFGSIGQTIAGALNSAIYFALSYGQEFDFTNLGLSIASGINNFFATFDFAGLAETINVWVQGLFEAFKTAISNIDWLQIYDKLIEVLENIDIETVAIVIGALSIKSIGKAILGQGVLSWLSSTLSSLLINVPVVLKNIKILAGGGLVAETGLLTKLANALALAAGGAGTLKEALTLTFGAVATTVAGIISTVGGGLLAITNFVSMLNDGFSWIKESLMLLGIAIAGVGAVILGAPAVAAAAIAGIVAAVSTAVVVIKDNWDSIGKFFSDLWDDIVKTADVLWENVCKIFEDAGKTIGDIVETLGQAISEIVDSIAGAVETGFTWIAETATEIWSGISGFLSETWDDIKKTASEKIEALKKDIAEKWENIKKNTTEKWNNIKQTLSTTWNNIKTTASTVWNNIKTTLSTVVNTIKNTVTTAFNTVRNTVTTVFNTVYNTISSKINAAKDAIERAIERIKDLFDFEFEWPDLKLPHFDIEGEFSLNPPRVPSIDIDWYAQGGVFNSPSIIGVGERGAEAVMPLEHNTGWIDDLADRIAIKMAQYGGASQQPVDVNVSIEGDMRNLFRAIKKESNAYRKQTGVSMI